MPNTNCYGRVFTYGPMAIKVHDYLLTGGPVRVSDMDTLIGMAAEELGFRATGHSILLPMMEFGGLIEIDREPQAQLYVDKYVADDLIRGVPHKVVEALSDEYHRGYAAGTLEAMDTCVDAIDASTDEELGFPPFEVSIAVTSKSSFKLTVEQLKQAARFVMAVDTTGVPIAVAEVADEGWNNENPGFRVGYTETGECELFREDVEERSVDVELFGVSGSIEDYDC